MGNAGGAGDEARRSPLDEVRGWLDDPRWPIFGPGIGGPGEYDPGRRAARAAVRQVLDRLGDAKVTMVADPNDGTHGVFLDGRLVCDSGDGDVTLNEDAHLFWPDAIREIVEALGGTLEEQSRYRPAKQEPFGGEWESYWPESLDGMGPVETFEWGTESKP